MPLTPFQVEVLAVLKVNRREESHFAGGLVLHADSDSARYSRDFDIFHEASAEVIRSSERDVEDLRNKGFEVDLISTAGEWEKKTNVSFRKARVRRGDQQVEIDWATDTAFRFFPVVEDNRLGWRLHLFDMAVNKALALASRTETRDYVDILELGRRCPLAAICWAAPGKDPGYSPLSLLKMMRRFARIDPAELDKIKARNLDPVAMKEAWIAMSDAAEAAMVKQANDFPDTPIGVVFVDDRGNPGWIGDDPSLKPHRPCIRGCWPRVRLQPSCE